MTAQRRGKIARLPIALREQLNGRMLNGEPGHQLVAWLNTLPEVQALLAAEFRGRPIQAQNLTHWRQGGYRDWLTDREARAAADRLAALALAGDAQGDAPLTDAFACWVAARYAVDTGRVDASEGEERWRLLRAMCHDIVTLRRGDHRAQQMALTQKRQALQLCPGRKRPSFSSAQQLMNTIPRSEWPKGLPEEMAEEFFQYLVESEKSERSQRTRRGEDPASSLIKAHQGSSM